MELGSEFELDVTNMVETEDNLFRYLKDYETVYTDGGRSAGRMLNTLLRKGRILLPSYICGSVVQIYDGQFEVEFYHINQDLTINVVDLNSKINESVTCVYLMNYFGRLQDEESLDYLRNARKKYGFKIIEDTTHSLFTAADTVGDYCICSLRKWFAIPDGGVLYSKEDISSVREAEWNKRTSIGKLEAMILKKFYVQGELECNELYRKIFVREEEKLDNNAEALGISDVSAGLLKCFSIQDMIKRRKNNYLFLYSVLSQTEKGLFLDDSDFVPFVFPLFRQDRNSLRQYLCDKQIYCAVHWPLEEGRQNMNADAVALSDSLISLPIDQRYGIEHMTYLAETIIGYREI